jgi:putative ABC transport system substrate-binding protein
VNIEKNLKKKITFLAMCAMLLALCSIAEAQQQAKIPKVGWLALRPSSSASGIELFRREIGKFGYIEGKNIAIEYRSADNRHDRLIALGEELVRLKVDILVTPAINETLAAKKITKTIPIVFAGISDPVGSAVVQSLAKPGGNATGFSNISSTLVGKRLELLKETVPKLFRAAILWNPKSQGSEESWNESQTAAQGLGLQLYSMEISSADKYESAFKEAIKSSATGVAVQSIITGTQRRIAELAAKTRLPAIYPREDYVDTGGLMSYGPDRAEPYSRVAFYVDKILKGGKPTDLPVEQPTKFDLSG